MPTGPSDLDRMVAGVGRNLANDLSSEFPAQLVRNLSVSVANRRHCNARRPPRRRLCQPRIRGQVDLVAVCSAGAIAAIVVVCGPKRHSFSASRPLSSSVSSARFPRNSIYSSSSAPCATGNKKAARTLATRAHPDGFIACWSTGKGSRLPPRTGPVVGAVAALSCPGSVAECHQAARFAPIVQDVRVEKRSLTRSHRSCTDPVHKLAA